MNIQETIQVMVTVVDVNILIGILSRDERNIVCKFNYFLRIFLLKMNATHEVKVA